MSLFHSILSQLQEKITKETTATETVATIVSEVLHTTITPAQIKVHGTTLRITAGPTIKMAIMMNKEKLLTSLQAASINITVIQ